MKLISLNTWGGKYFDPLIKFIKQHSQDTDIFCFQEIYNTTSAVKQYKNIRANLLGELIKILPDFRVFLSTEFSGFDSNSDPVDFDLTVGKAILVKNNIPINAQGELLIYGDKTEKSLNKDFSNLPITLQYINFSTNGKAFAVGNFHGTSFPGSKLDTKLRLEQSTKIQEFLKGQQGAKILVGDFNLLPQTQSIKMLESNMRNLIKEFNIAKTRSSLSPFFGRSGFQKFADYAFISPDVRVTNFQVPDVNISDHLPMILEFSLKWYNLK